MSDTPFAQAVSKSEQACKIADDKAFTSAFSKALVIATDGITDTVEIRRLFELLSAYPVLSNGSPKEGMYNAWFDAVHSVLQFDPMGKHNFEAGSVLQAQANTATLLLKTDGIPFLDAQRVRTKYFTRHLETFGKFLGKIATAGVQPKESPVDMYALSDEASNALTESGEPFISGGDPTLLMNEKARQLVQRDYERNSKLAKNLGLRSSQRDAADWLQSEAIMAVKTLVQQDQISDVSAAKALASKPVPQAKWLELFKN